MIGLLAIWLCPICGIGSWKSNRLLGVFFGLGAIGFLILFLWFLLTGQFKQTGAPLEAGKFLEKNKK